MSDNIEDFSGGESVKVALRIRPMNAMEINRGDEQCIKPLSDKTC
jgi:kinesin family protein 12